MLYSDAGNQDRVVIQELIKTVAQSQQIQSSTQREFKGRIYMSYYCLSVAIVFQNLVSSCSSVCKAIILDLTSYSVNVFVHSGVADRSGPTHQRRPACFASDYGKIHGHLPPHSLLQLHLQGHRADSEPLSGHQSSSAQHRRGHLKWSPTIHLLAIVLHDSGQVQATLRTFFSGL